MDDSLLAEFHAVFSVSGEANDTRAPHPHYTLYKQRREGYGDQEARRKRLLDQQRSKRRDYADYARKIVEGEAWEEEEDGEEEVDAGDSDDTTVSRKRKRESEGEARRKRGAKKQKKYKVHPYRNQLMQSEWLLSVPEDFEQDWIMTVCPVGRRSLVISSRRTTSAYSRSGQCINNFPSLLPGGFKSTFHTASDYCILDCIHHEVSRTYYVLDVMCWHGHPVYDCDTEFRTFWLRTKLAEEGDKVATHSRTNPLRFLPLECFPCTKDSITRVLSTSWPLEVDGLLFIHKKAHYVTTRSPLALWLKPHMVPDLLNVPVSPEFLACAPVMSAVKMDSSSAGQQEVAASGCGNKETGKEEPAVSGCGNKETGKEEPAVPEHMDSSSTGNDDSEQ